MVTANMRTSFIACLPPPAWSFGLVSTKGLSLIFSFSWAQSVSEWAHESPLFRPESCMCCNGMSCWIGVRDACCASHACRAGRPLSPSASAGTRRLLDVLPRVQAVPQATALNAANLILVCKQELFQTVWNRNCEAVWRLNARETLALRWDVSVIHTLTWLFFNLGFIMLSFQMKWAFTHLGIAHTDECYWELFLCHWYLDSRI